MGCPSCGIRRHSRCYYLVFLIPAQVIPASKLLRAFDHKVDEVSTASQDAGNEEVGQYTQESPQVDVLILLVLLFIHDGFLQHTR